MAINLTFYLFVVKERKKETKYIFSVIEIKTFFCIKSIFPETSWLTEKYIKFNIQMENRIRHTWKLFKKKKKNSRMNMKNIIDLVVSSFHLTNDKQ